MKIYFSKVREHSLLALGILLTLGALLYGHANGLAIGQSDSKNYLQPGYRPKTAKDAFSRGSQASSPATELPESVGIPWPLWEFELRDPLPPREPTLTPPSWRLVGATFSIGHWQLLVSREGSQEVQYLKVGEKLPGGYLITAISDSEVTLKHGRRQLTLAYIATP
ncbi:hypothetical protein HNQ51_001806 [Inhella inkyongensis]|uniref:Type II secretion system protein GspC N-terminal domain-containing protein n=1 Tax=Inhella inkyongensis TaxID=392593 RepID=A0A840S4K5_9BURK|nr:hypothetical protein [Inhella inkyongensis]MBB5204492.1 hypothetical protein [Inhella inkyongensis]